MDDRTRARDAMAPTVVATYHEGGRITRLVRFADGSMGIRRDGVPLGLWGAGDADACFDAFVRLVGPLSAADVLVVRRARPGIPRVSAN